MAQLLPFHSLVVSMVTESEAEAVPHDIVALHEPEERLHPVLPLVSPVADKGHAGQLEDVNEQPDAATLPDDQLRVIGSFLHLVIASTWLIWTRKIDKHKTTKVGILLMYFILHECITGMEL